MGKREILSFDSGTGRSLSAMCRKLVAKFEEIGVDVEAIFQKIGGKSCLFQYAQDLDDDVINAPAEVFKSAYKDENIRRCARAIVNMMKKDWFLHKRGIRTVLYTEGNLLKNPLHYSFSQDDYEKTKKILSITIRYLKQLSEEEGASVSKEMMETCNKELVQLSLLYECMYQNRVQNEKWLSESEFLKNSLPQIIKSFLVFFQSQYNLDRAKMAKRWNKQDYITGVESLVASEAASLGTDVHVSMSDSLEQLLENMDTLFRYIYYLKDDETELPENVLLSMEFLSPDESPEFQMLVALATIDSLFTKLEASFRFSGWDIERRAMPEEGWYCFYPQDDKPYKLHIAAGFRNKYRLMVGPLCNVTKSTDRNQQSPCDYIESLNSTPVDSGGPECLPGGFYQEYLPASKRMNLNDVKEYHFDEEEYADLVKHVNPIIEAARNRNKSFYFSCCVNGMSVKDYLNAYVFLYIFSKIYYCKAVSQGAQKDLVVMVSLEYLYNEFSKIYKYDYGVAQKIIDCYVFDSKTSKHKKFGDIFTRPLINIGSGMVLISEALIQQINIDRNIEVFLDWNDVNLSPMGKELEKRLREELKKVDGIFVNTNKVEFPAYDGKNVEFDFIAVIGEYLLLIEMKSLLRPYDDDELYKRRKTLFEGIVQIKRRVKIVQKDWDKLKRLVNINLPDTPYDENHIIKVVCTDVCSYTGMEEQGVIITDEVTLLKYFTNPYVMGVLNKQEEGVKFIEEQTLWKNGRPTAEEFISYLRCPSTMDYIMKCIEPEWKKIPLWDGYRKVAFLDMVIKEDPIRKLLEKYCQI